ncbi:MAG: hypothetical protein WBA07_12980 [Rivularia sp. (in: cyanobacteria)]
MNLIIVIWLLAMSFAFWIAYLNFQAHSKIPWVAIQDILNREFGTPLLYKRQKRQRRKTRKPRNSSIPKHLPAWGQLLMLVRHDEKTAVRLYNYAKNCNPGKSEKWVLEKALWDLERDRF